MADLYDPSPPVGDASLDDMMLYSDAPAEPHSVQDSTVDMGQNFAFDVNQMSTEQLEDAMLSSEGFSSNYIPHTSENDIQHMQAYSPHPNVDQVSFSAPSHVGNPFSWQSPSSVPPSQDAMTEFFKMMSHPENVQAYMHFLQTQHEQPPQAPISTAPIRSRSNSNPAASTLPSAFSLRPSTTDTLTDSSSREKKLAKYRTKRARRLTSSQISNSDTGPTSLLSAGVEGMEGDRFMPAPKMPKTLTHDLENRLISSEEEVKMLRSVLESRDVELQILRHVLFEEQQYQQWAMHNFGDASSNASSSAATSPRPHSPSTPAMVSSPSSISLGSSTMDAEFMSLDTSSMGSDHMMEVMAANQRRQEKLKQLGGPPSDVYHPWWNGIPLNHPAFSQKEDWQHFELRPQERLAHERLNYFLTMQRYRVEQNGLSESSAPTAMNIGTPPTGVDFAGNGPQVSTSPSIHSPSPSFYQSPHHHSHIMTGSPAQGSGYWSGHFAPANAEKIDFSKISLRKTGPTPSTAMATSPLTPNGMMRPLNNKASSSQMPISPQQMQESPTAAIWRDAMAHPEMHRFPSRWLQEQSPSSVQGQQPQQHARLPFRRAAPAANNMHMNSKPITPPSPQQQMLQQQLQQQLQSHMQQHNMRFSPTNPSTPTTTSLSAQNAARRLQSPSSN